MNLRPTLVLVVPLLVLACGKDKPGKPSTDDTGPSHDTGPDPDCDTGELDDDGECVPAACGTGTWGNLEADEGTVHVDVAAAEGGDGSQVAPFTSIQAGLDAAGDAGGGMVAVAAGSYPETLKLDRGHDGVRLTGRCRELVFIDASTGGESTPGIEVNIGSSEAEVSGVTVSGSRFDGVLVGSGTLTLRDSAVIGSEFVGVGAYQAGLNGTALTMEGCVVQGNTSAGVAAAHSDTSVTLWETAIEDNLPDENGEHGFGLQVSEGASLYAEACSVRRNVTAGVIAYDAGSSATLRETSIEDNLPDENGEHGFGLQVSEGASLVTEACAIRGNATAGVFAFDPSTSADLRETAIEQGRPDEHGEGGFGVVVSGGAGLDTDGCEISGNTAIGVLALDSGTSVALRATAIEHTQPDGIGRDGQGIDVRDGASLMAEDCEIRGNTAVGLLASASGTTVTLCETTIEDTHPEEEGGHGYGIQVSEGASLEAEACELRMNTAVGVLVGRAGATATLRDSSIASTRRGEIQTVGVGLAVQTSASVVATGIELSSNEGPGVYVAMEDAQLACSHCVFEDNQFAGAVVVLDATLELSDTLIEGTTEQENLGGGVGIFAEPWLGGPPNLSVSDSTIQDNAIAGVWLSDQGSYALTDNVIHGGEGWTRGSLGMCGDAVYARGGLTAWDGSAGLLLEKNQLLNGRGAGLFLHNANATLSGNAYADNAVDLVVQGTDCATPPQGYEDEGIGSAQLCPAYDYPTCGDEFRLYMTLEEPGSTNGAAFLHPGLPGPGALRLPMSPATRPGPQGFRPLPARVERKLPASPSPPSP